MLIYALINILPAHVPVDLSSCWHNLIKLCQAQYYLDLTTPPIRDPTNGAVDYLSKDDALKSKLARISNGQVRLAVDSTGKVDPALGRPAVRLESKDTFDSGLLV